MARWYVAHPPPPPLGSPARLAQVASSVARKGAVLLLSGARAAPRAGAPKPPSRRLLPVQARASTDASGADATFLVYISLAVSIVAADMVVGPCRVRRAAARLARRPMRLSRLARM